MPWALIASLVILLSEFAAAENTRPQMDPGSTQTVAGDAQAEQQLLDLANQARAQAGMVALQPDDGMTQAARVHAETMAAQQQLSHQFSGEPSLLQRLASSSSLHLDRAGENVAMAATVERAQEVLMASPPHRENLLEAGYNVAGFGVVHFGNALYIVEDFGQGAKEVSAQASDDLVVAKVQGKRQDQKLPPLKQLDKQPAQTSACAMAKADSLKPAPPRAQYVIRYTAMQPGTLPSSVGRAIIDPAVKGFSAGTCYARTRTYPNGVYWVTLLFY